MENIAQKAEPIRGPNPLPVHIGLAALECARAQQGGVISYKGMDRVLEGIRKYQDHSFRRAMTDLPVVWTSGEVRIFHCAAQDSMPGKNALLLVPSLINRSSIFDLLPEKSFVRWLAAQGIDAYLLDWGTPLDDAALRTADDLVTERLCPALDHVADRAGNTIHALGYCMGGTLLAAAALRVQDKLRSAVFLASPWDFHAGDRNLETCVRAGTLSALQMTGRNGYLPKDWIQSVFAAANAGRAMKKFLEFAALEDDSDGARLFVAVEDWLNDGVDLPQGLAETCILDWYGRNRPGLNGWDVAGERVDLSKLSVPALVIASANDRLVPRESALAMAAAIPGAKTLEPLSGHIGMMTGRRAEEQVWKNVARWVADSV